MVGGGGNVGGRWVDIVKFVAVNYADHHMLVHTLYLRIGPCGIRIV